MTAIIILFVVLLLMGMPIAFVIGISSLIFFLGNPDLSLDIAAQKMVSSTQSFTFLAVPFFLTAGNIMNASGITERLVKFAKVLTGHMVGGLAQVSVMLSALMGGISGSAVADASMEARFLGPSMINSGYSKGFVASVLSYGGLITATIPPSLGLIVYGFVGDVSVGRLFVAGIIPGLLMTVILMVPTHIISKKRNYKVENEKPPRIGDVFKALKESFWALLFPLILIVGIRFGFFTTSEAGAFAIVYAMFVGKFIYKDLTLKKLIAVIDTSVSDNGVILLIITAAGIFGFVSAYSGMPAAIAKFITSITTNKYILLLLITVFLLFMGMVMESTVNCLIFTPIFLPILKSVGVNPVHFGIVMMTLVTMGCMTPPVGTAMYSVCQILNCPTDEYMKEGLPYIITILAEILLLIFIPQISLFLPNLIFGK
ncbi:TRAP transporter large permease subunit [Treponema sp. OMZ 840]|uniref:TRAP transporter large permease n=1 Tax=Treponema sp. OMZ 840 TaxID=244313 RepID=UPI003D94B01A